MKPIGDTPNGENRDAATDASRDAGSTMTGDSSEPSTGDDGDGDDGDDGDDGTTVDAGSDTIDAGPGEPPPPGCDLRGSYFMNERMVTQVIGVQQVAWHWYYVEIAQSGTNLTMSLATECGGSLEAPMASPFKAHTDDEAAWPAYRKQKTYTGRKGTVTASAGGCDVTWEQGVVVHGATVDTYSNLDVKLPTKDQSAAANGGKGWEDWEMDGNPGVTLILSGLASGELYIASRIWASSKGTIAKNASTWQVNFDWEQERSTLGASSPSEILNAPAGRDPDEAQHLVEFAKLTPDQAAGDANARCDRLIPLAATLTPKAAAY